MTLWNQNFCSRKNFGELKIDPLDNSFSPDCSVAKASFDTFLTLRKVDTPKDYIVLLPPQSFRASPIETPSRVFFVDKKYHFIPK